MVQARSFVIVHGAFQSATVWNNVAANLKSAGHLVAMLQRFAGVSERRCSSARNSARKSSSSMTTSMRPTRRRWSGRLRRAAIPSQAKFTSIKRQPRRSSPFSRVRRRYPGARPRSSTIVCRRRIGPANCRSAPRSGTTTPPICRSESCRAGANTDLRRSPVQTSLVLRSPDAAQRACDALLIRGPSFCDRHCLGPGSAKGHFVPHRIWDKTIAVIAPTRPGMTALAFRSRSMYVN